MDGQEKEEDDGGESKAEKKKENGCFIYRTFYFFKKI